jgi:RNA polymerase sigma-70 factor (ECF subfamily)
MVDEKKLVESLRRGDAKAINAIFENYYQKLCFYAETILRDQFDAEEVVEQLFIQLWINSRNILITTSLKNYLYRSVHNNCLKYIEKHRTERKAYEHYVFHDPELLSPIDGDYALSNLLVQELEHKASQIMESLPEQCKNIYYLSRYHGLSYPEIANKLGVTVGTVKTQMSRAFQKFRDGLKDYLPFLVFIFLN